MNWLTLGLPTPSIHTNVIVMFITLKLIGVAFERRAVLAKESRENRSKTSYEKELQDIDIANIVHYFLNYIGLVFGRVI